MSKYRGKAKCSCGKRATWKAENDGHPKFRCRLHKEALSNISDYNEYDDNTIAADLTYKRLR